MWNAIWINANLATMTEGDTPYGAVENAALGIEDGKIAWVGAMDALPGAPEELAHVVYDAQGQWITPGLIDCHTHIVYGGNRAQEFEMRLKGASYEEIAKSGGGIISTVKATREADEDTLFASALKRVQSLARDGVTGLEIKSGYGLNTETEARMLRVATKLRDATGLRVQRTFLGAHALPPEFKDNPDGYIDLVSGEMMDKIVEESLADAVDAFGENIGFTPEQVAKVFDAAQKHGLPVKLHADQMSNQHGGAQAARYRALSADHLEHTDTDGVKAMAQSGTVAVILPGAFYTLRETKLPPIELFREHGVAMALATDCNPGSSPVASLLLILNMGCTLFRLTPEEALAGVTRNAARALGWQDICGRIETGMAADLALWDIARPAELAYMAGYSPCTGIVTNGDFTAFPR